jgi:molybdenum cofactor cytidylyltransferase
VRIVGILLAAGRGVRFGGEKLLAPLATADGEVAPGTPVGIAACRHLVAALPESLAVVRTGDRALAGLLAGAGARVVECPRADEGMGASLACAIAASGDAEGWVIALADMPWVQPATIAAVAQALGGGAEIVAPTWLGERGHPVGFARRHRDALLALEGDAGARAIMAAHRAALQLVPVADPGVVRDVDEPANL